MFEKIELTPGFFVMRETAPIQEVVFTPSQEVKVIEMATNADNTDDALKGRIKDLASEFNDLSGSIVAMERASKLHKFAKYDLDRLDVKKKRLEEVRGFIAHIRTQLALNAAVREEEYNKKQDEKRLFRQKKSKEQAMRQAERNRKDNEAKASHGKKKG